MIRRVFSVARVGIAIALLAHLSACNGCQQPVDETDFFDPSSFGEYEFDGEPDIEAPERILFGEVAAGTVGTQTAEIRNVGREKLKFSEWRISDGFELSYTNSTDAPDELEPGEAVTVVIAFNAPDDEEHRGTLVVESNDPDEPVTEIQLFVNATFPCLETIPDDVVDFGEIDPGDTLPRIVTIRNCSPNAETTFTIEGISGSDAFAFTEPVDTRRVLAIGEEIDVVIGFTPPEAGLFEGALDIVSDDEFRPEHSLELRGIGAEGQCPSAIISGVSDISGGEFVANPNASFQTIPLDRMLLRGDESIAYDGKFIDEYAWSLVRRPQDSAARYTNGPEAMDQELFLDLAGEYVLELEVWDNEGVKSCNTARVTVQAVADEDIHVQLVWDTPNDPNQNDSSGSDVDLHLLHSNGTWNRSPWDCFWQNLIPDWATDRPNGVDSFDCERDPDREGCHDDPSLDIDDVDGWGPENINLNNPELNETYNVGVHYFSDHGYGMSLATVRIYIGGVLRAEYPRQQLFDQEFWHVADVTWPAGDVNARGQVYDTFP